MHYLFIPQKIVAHFGGKFPIRVICTVNNKIQFQGGMVFLSEGNAYISIAKSRMQAADAVLGDTVHLKLEEDTSEFGTELPGELIAVLEQDVEGKMRFDLLKKSMQRYVINYVKTVKNSDKRIERALLLIENLKRLQKGKETFREMLGMPPREN
jgi:hypothetical protein